MDKKKTKILKNERFDKNMKLDEWKWLKGGEEDERMKDGLRWQKC